MHGLLTGQANSAAWLLGRPSAFQQPEPVSQSLLTKPEWFRCTHLVYSIYTYAAECSPHAQETVNFLQEAHRERLRGIIANRNPFRCHSTTNETKQTFRSRLRVVPLILACSCSSDDHLPERFHLYRSGCCSQIHRPMVRRDTVLIRRPCLAIGKK